MTPLQKLGLTAAQITAIATKLGCPPQPMLNNLEQASLLHKLDNDKTKAKREERAARALRIEGV